MSQHHIPNNWLSPQDVEQLQLENIRNLLLLFLIVSITIIVFCQPINWFVDKLRIIGANFYQFNGSVC